MQLPNEGANDGLPKDRFSNIRKVRKRQNFGNLLFCGNFLRNGQIIFLYFLHAVSWDDIDQLSRDGFD